MSNYQTFYSVWPNTFSIHEVLIQKATDKSVWVVIPALFEGQKKICIRLSQEKQTTNNTLKPYKRPKAFFLRSWKRKFAD